MAALSPMNWRGMVYVQEFGEILLRRLAGLIDFVRAISVSIRRAVAPDSCRAAGIFPL